MSQDLEQSQRTTYEFELIADERSRIHLPNDVRNRLTSSFVVTRGPDGTVLLLPNEVWERIEAALMTSILDRRLILLQRLFGGRTVTKLDPQGRLTIPKPLRDYANIRSNHPVLIINQGMKYEVWDKDRWDAYNVENFTSERAFASIEASGLVRVFG